MIEYSVLLGILAIIFCISYTMSGCYLASPGPLFLVGMMVSVALATIGLNRWNSVEISGSVITLISIGCLSFVAGCILSEKKIGKSRREASNSKKIINKSTNLSIRYIIVILLVITSVILRIYETYQIANELGLSSSNYFELAKAIRTQTATFVSSDSIRVGVGYSFIERQFEKVAIGAGYVGCYLMLKNYFSKKYKTAGLAGLILLVSVVFTIITGSRSNILHYVVCLFICYFILKVHSGEQPRKLSKKILIVGCLSAIIGSLVFYYMGAAIGRDSALGVIDYVSFYFGCSVPSLQMILDVGFPSVPIVGVRTFYYLTSVIYKLGLVESFPSYSIAWVNINGNSSNVFTCFARYFADFGLVGIVALSFIAGFILTGLFRIACTRKHDILVLLIAYISPYIFDMAREEFLFSRLLSPTQAISIIVMVLMTYYLLGVSINNTNKRIKKNLICKYTQHINQKNHEG